MQKTSLGDWLWDEAPMLQVERELEEYISDLFVALDMGEDIDTLSGYGFDGCATCETREYLSFLMPRILDMYANKQIRSQDADKDSL